MNLREFITCSQCMRELHPTYQKEIEHSMVSNYHCEQCCYSFSIYSITKDKLAEIQHGENYPLDNLEEELEVMEQHEMEDK